MDPRIGVRDLRLKLQKKAYHSSDQSQSGKSSEVGDLWEKLSGLTQVQPRNSDPPRTKPVVEVVKLLKRSNYICGSTCSQSSKKKSQQKVTFI
ncbi:hypothetical protein QJS04_geneDACA023338 [Acorus gramineus]|uniref:Uncharacterized protein n=1 Tax=Acorus gramineus TaxID=55184 RepID=A0AAV9A6S6_ACOGR|nr:hypothetical protein QJS04_geneDACA023338 [Acorus gramineus]